MDPPLGEEAPLPLLSPQDSWPPAPRVSLWFWALPVSPRSPVSVILFVFLSLSSSPSLFLSLFSFPSLFCLLSFTEFFPHSKCWSHRPSLTPYKSPRKTDFYLAHFSDGETQAQGDLVTCLFSQPVCGPAEIGIQVLWCLYSVLCHGSDR